MDSASLSLTYSQPCYSIHFGVPKDSAGGKQGDCSLQKGIIIHHRRAVRSTQLIYRGDVDGDQNAT